MARLAAQANVKSLFNGEGVPSSGSGSDPKDPFSCMFTFSSLKPQKRRLTSFDSTRIYSSSPSNKIKRLNGEVRLFFGDQVADNKVGLGDGDDVDDDDDDEFARDDLSCFRGLVLDISYRPINVVCWKRAICLEFMDKADVLEYYDQTVNSPSGSFYIPAVLRVPHLLQVVKRRKIKCNLSRKNILCRDSFTCHHYQTDYKMYCSSRQNLTIDHVIPIARGGEWKWDNLVTACAKCNSRKGQKTVEEACMKLMKIPKAPKDYDILAIPLTNAAVRMLRMREGTPEEWLQYLSKPSSMP